MQFETFGKESLLTALRPKKTVALSVGSFNIDQRVVADASVENKNNISKYKTHDNTNEEVGFCENAKRNAPSSAIDDTNKTKCRSSEVSSCEQVESDAWSSTIDGYTESCKRSEVRGVNSRKQVQTSSTAYNTEGPIRSDLDNLNKGTASVEANGSDRVVSDDISDLDNLNNRMTSLGPKSSDRGVSNKYNLEG